MVLWFLFFLSCSVKCRVTKLCSQSESDLRNILQDPLLVYAQWSHMVSEVLEASADVTDFPHFAVLVQSIEVKHMHFLKEGAAILLGTFILYCII